MQKRKNAFNVAFQYTLKNEVGHGKNTVEQTNDKHDSGGFTRYGVSSPLFAEAKKEIRTLPEKLESITLAHAAAIYLIMFWNKLNLEKVDDVRKAVIVFDAAVLFGVSRVARFVQECLNAVSEGETLLVDGVIGPKSLRTLNTCNYFLFRDAFQKRLRERIDFVVKASAKNQRYRNGWHNRVSRYSDLPPFFDSA